MRKRSTKDKYRGPNTATCELIVTSRSRVRIVACGIYAPIFQRPAARAEPGGNVT